MADNDPAILYQGQIRPRRGTASELAELNPIPADGEMIRATDTNVTKFGDGTNPWSDLPAAWPSGGSVASVNNKAPDLSGNVSITATDIPGIPAPYTLPPATSSVIGGVKPGSGLSVTEDGTLNATGGGGGSTNLIVSGCLQSPYQESAPPSFYQKILAATFLPKSFVLKSTAEGCYAFGSYVNGSVQTAIVRVVLPDTTPEIIGEVDLSVDPPTFSIPSDVTFNAGDQLMIFLIASNVDLLFNTFVTLSLESV